MTCALAKPTLGFPTKRDAIRHLHDRGSTPDVIARNVGSTTDSVRTTLCRLGLTPHANMNRRAGQVSQLLELTPELVKLLRPHASRRGLPTYALAAMIIHTVVDADLVDNVLDDGE